MLDSLQFMSSFQLGTPLCKLIAGFPFEMTADLFTFGYSGSIVFFFFFFNVSHNCHITLCAIRRKQVFNINRNTKSNAILCSPWCGGKEKNHKPRSEYSCYLCDHLHKRLNNHFTITCPNFTSLIIKREQWNVQIYLLIGYLNCSVPITWLTRGHSGRVASMNFSQNFYNITIANDIL